jgi:hypothetical protein
MKMHRFAVPLIAACLLAVIGCTSAPPDTSKSQIQQLQQQLKADEATLAQLQQQEQADQALLKQIQQELSELRKRRDVPCPHWVDPDADWSIGSAVEGDSKVGGKTSPDGSEEIQVDLPGQEHMKNKGGTDGAGLCVFTSIEIAAHWMNVEELRGLQEKMTHEQGGGWPEKVDQMMKKYAPDVDYVQYSGNDPSILKLALKTGRMAGVTYGYSPRYKSKISHMIDLVHFTDKWAAVLDNNYPGEDQYEWMPPDEFLNRWKSDSGGGWVIVLLSGNPPPPIPINATTKPAGCNCCRGCLCGSSCNCKANGTPCCRRCDCAKRNGDCAKRNGRAPNVSEGCSCEDKHHCPYPRWWHWAPICWRCHTHRPYCDDVEAWPFIRRIPRPFHPRPIGPRPIGPFPKPKCEDVISAPDDPDFTFLWQWIFRIDIFRRHDVENYGITRDQMPKDPDANPFYSHNGQRITALEAFELVGKGGTLTDDTQKKRLTVIGTKDQTDRVLADLQTNAELAIYRDKLVVNAYTPTHWAVAGVGLSQGITGGLRLGDWIFGAGGPAIILQAPPDAKGKGIVLHLQKDYSDGPHGLAKAIRKADSSYDPKRDPDLREDCPNCPDQPDPAPSMSCPVYWTLISVVLLVARMLVPDIVFGIGWMAGKAMSSLKSHASKEVAALKAELAAMKQKPAA